MIAAALFSLKRNDNLGVPATVYDTRPSVFRMNTRRRRPNAVSALAYAGYQPDATYLDCVRLLSDVDVCSRAAFEPKQRRDVSAVQQAARSGSSRYALPFHGGDKLAFARSAMRLEHPSAVEAVDLPEDAVDAIAFTVAHRSHIAEWRERRLRLLTDVSHRLGPLTRHMRRSLTPQAAKVVGTYHLALFACVIDAFRYPDVAFVRHLMRGFPGCVYFYLGW